MTVETWNHVVKISNKLLKMLSQFSSNEVYSNNAVAVAIVCLTMPFQWLSLYSIKVQKHEYEWGGCTRWALHRNHFLIYCAFPILSIPPVVPDLVRSTVSCITESSHGCFSWILALTQDMWHHFGLGAITCSGCYMLLGDHLALAFRFLHSTSDNLVFFRWNLTTLGGC
jgi:hypothetical protein